MIKILFICHGNICRSPMAEFVFVHLARERGVGERFSVASCATSTEEIIGGIGNPVYPPAKRELARHGISCDGKRAVQLQKSDYAKYDLFICMDSNNLRNAERIFGGDKNGKLHKLLEYCGETADVSDPWYTRQFDICYNDILKGCNALLEAMK